MQSAKVKQTKFGKKTLAGMTLIGSVLTLMCSAGAVYGSSAMSVVPIAEKLGVTVGTTQQYSTFWSLGVIVAAIVGGKIISKLDFGGTCVLGGTLGALGLMLMGMATNIPMYYLGAFLTGWPIVIAGPALLQTAISKWFYSGRATLIGIVGMTEAIGTTIVSMRVASVISKSGNITGAMLFAAAFIFIGNLLAGLVFFRGAPEDYGMTPIGYENLVSDDESAELKGLTKEEAFKKSYFWMFLAAMMILNISYSFVQPQMSAYVQFVGYSAAQAGIVVSVWSWGKGLSKIVYGLIGDRFGIRTGLCSMSLLALVAVVMYIFVKDFPLLIVCAAGIGIMGGVTGSGTLGVSRMVGQKDFLRMALLPHAANCIGFVISPTLFALIFDGTAKTYRLAGWISALALCVYIVLVFFALSEKNLIESGNSFKKK